MFGLGDHEGVGIYGEPECPVANIPSREVFFHTFTQVFHKYFPHGVIFLGTG